MSFPTKTKNKYTSMIYTRISCDQELFVCGLMIIVPPSVCLLRSASNVHKKFLSPIACLLNMSISCLEPCGKLSSSVSKMFLILAKPCLRKVLLEDHPCVISIANIKRS